MEEPTASKKPINLFGFIIQPDDEDQDSQINPQDTQQQAYCSFDDMLQKGCSFDLNKILGGLVPAPLWDWLHQQSEQHGQGGSNQPSPPSSKSVNNNSQAVGCLKLYSHFEYPFYDRHSSHTTFLQLRAGRRPLNVVVVLDGNKSMATQGKLELSRLAFKLLMQRFSEYDVVALCTWNSGVTAYPPVNVTVEGLSRLEAFIDGVHPPTAPESQSSLTRAIDIGLKRLLGMNKGEGGNANENLSALVLLTDGGDPPPRRAGGRRNTSYQQQDLSTSTPIPSPLVLPSPSSPPSSSSPSPTKRKTIFSFANAVTETTTVTAAGNRTTTVADVSTPEAVDDKKITPVILPVEEQLTPQQLHEERVVKEAKEVLRNHPTRVPVFAFSIGGSTNEDVLKRVIDNHGGHYHIFVESDVEYATKACARQILRASGDNAVVTFEATGYGVQILEVIASPITVEMIQPRTKYSVYLGEVTDGHPKDVVFRVSLPNGESSATTTVGRAWLEYEDQTKKDAKERSIKRESLVTADRPILDGSSNTNHQNLNKRDHFLVFLVLKHRVPLIINEAFQFMETGDYTQAKIMLEGLASELRRFDMECSHENNGIIVHPLMRDVKNALTQVGEEKDHYNTMRLSTSGGGRRGSVLGSLTMPSSSGSSTGGGGHRSSIVAINAPVMENNGETKSNEAAAAAAASASRLKAGALAAFATSSSAAGRRSSAKGDVAVSATGEAAVNNSPSPHRTDVSMMDQGGEEGGDGRRSSKAIPDVQQGEMMEMSTNNYHVHYDEGEEEEIQEIGGALPVKKEKIPGGGGGRRSIFALLKSPRKK